MKIYKIYNSSDCLVFAGNEQEYNKLKEDNLINDSDRLVIAESTEIKFTIYQALNPTFMVEKGKTQYKIGDYKIVYERVENRYDREDETILEDLFMELNRDVKPEGYKGWSLSVGDIVEIDDNLYICDSFGWNKINWVKD